MNEVEKVVIVGSGPAGLTAAIYTARAQLEPMVLVGEDLGGQISWTYSVENYPGFPDLISGPDLVDKMRFQAEKFGARLVYESVRKVDFGKEPFLIQTDSRQILSKSVIVCSGARPQKLNVPGEIELIGKGVSYCSVCDGPFFKDKDLAVVGGGNSALDEGNYLTRFARKLIIIHRRDRFRAEQIYLDRAKKNPKIEFILSTAATRILGKDRVEGLAIKNLKTGEAKTLPIGGVFVYIGQIPNTEFFQGQLDLDEKGYIKVDRYWQTSVPGVFAAGECEDWRWKQMVSSCGDASKAALSAQKYLEDKYE